MRMYKVEPSVSFSEDVSWGLGGWAAGAQGRGGPFFPGGKAWKSASKGP